MHFNIMEKKPIKKEGKKILTLNVLKIKARDYKREMKSVMRSMGNKISMNMCSLMYPYCVSILRSRHIRI